MLISDVHCPLAYGIDILSDNAMFSVNNVELLYVLLINKEMVPELLI